MCDFTVLAYGGYIQISTVFLYIRNYRLKNKIFKILLTMAFKNMNY